MLLIPQHWIFLTLSRPLPSSHSTSLHIAMEDSRVKKSQLLHCDDTQAIQSHLPAEVDEPKVDELAVDEPAVEEEDGNALKLTLPLLDIPPLAPQDSGELSKLNSGPSQIQPDLAADVDEPAVDEPVTDEPVIDEPVTVNSGPSQIQPDLAADVDEPVVDEPVTDEPVIDEPATEVVAVNAPRIAFRLAPLKSRLGPTLLEFQEDGNALKLKLPLLDISLLEPTQVTGKLAKPHILNSVEIGLGAVADCRIGNMRTFVASFIPVYREEGFKDDLFSLKKRLVRLMWDGVSVLDALRSAEARATLSSDVLDEERSKILMDSVKYTAMFCVVTGGSLDDVLMLSMSDMKCFGSVQAS